MKILECKRGKIYDIGFIDPYYNHHQSVEMNPHDTENNLVKELRFSSTKREILFPYNFKWVLYYTHILFSLTRCYYKCTYSWLVMRTYVSLYFVNHYTWQRRSNSHGPETHTPHCMDGHAGMPPEVISIIMALHRQLLVHFLIARN